MKKHSFTLNIAALLFFSIIYSIPDLYSQQEKQTYFVTLEAEPAYAASMLTGAGTYEHGETVTVQTQGIEGWYFTGWTENGVVVSELHLYSFQITSDRHLVANFINVVDLFANPGSLDFGLVAVGECRTLEFFLRSLWTGPQSKPLVDLMLISDEGVQTVHRESYSWMADFADTTYHTYYAFYGEFFYARFCPTENKIYDGAITVIHPADTLIIPFTGRGTTNAELINLTLALEGPFLPSGNNIMHTLLSDQQLLPYYQPFRVNRPFFQNPDPLWYYEPIEHLQTSPDGVVDWVLVELRDGPTPEQASTIIERKPALLLADGKVTGPDRQPLLFPVDHEHNLFVIVYHRNHIPVMSSGPLVLQQGGYFWDFTLSAGMAHGEVQKHLGQGIYGLYAGDGDGNGQVQNQDKNNVWEPQVGLWGYNQGDFSLNGQVQQQDKNDYWEPNTGISAVIPGILLPTIKTPVAVDP
jgi:hypothetical protein